MNIEAIRSLSELNQKAVTKLTRCGYRLRPGPDGLPSVSVAFQVEGPIDDEPTVEEYVGVWETPLLAYVDLDALSFPESQRSAVGRARQLLTFVAMQEEALNETDLPYLDADLSRARVALGQASLAAAMVAVRVGSWVRTG